MNENTTHNNAEKIIYSVKDDAFLPEYAGVMFTKKNNDAFHTRFDIKIKNKIEKFFEEKQDPDILICKCDPTDQNKIRTGAVIEEEGVTEYSFFKLNCEKDEDVVLIIRVSRHQKLWVNYKLININKPDDVMTIISLKKGLNSIVFESADTHKTDTLFVRISTLTYEKSVYPKIIDDNMINPNDYCYIYDNGYYFPDENKKYKMLFFPNNEPNEVKSRKAIIEVYRVFPSETQEKEELVYACKIDPKKALTIDFSMFDDPGSTVFFSLRLKYRYKDGLEHKSTVRVSTHKAEQAVEVMKILLNDRINNNSSTPYDKLTAKYYLETISSSIKDVRKLDAIQEYFRKCNKIHKTGHFDEEIYRDGFKKVLFYSKTFETIDMFFAYLPPNYDKDKKYPLIILANTKDRVHGRYFVNYRYEDIITIDFSLKGITLGSYIGEASINDVMNEVGKYYKYDEDRVYITGYSNGGAASISQAQLYPDRYAGILPFATGAFNPNNAVNVSNLKVIAITATNDNRYYVFRSIDKMMKEINHKDYTSYNPKDFSHVTSHFLWINRKTIKELLESERNNYPENIEFVTSRNRSRKAYWVEIHSIEKGKKTAKIQAALVDRDISINIENATGFTIHLPPTVANNDFSLTINKNAHFDFQKKNRKTVNVKIKNNKFFLCSKQQRITDQHKGNGLLDVYIDPLVIVVPDKDEKDSQMTKSAQTFSNPTTNGFDRRIYISYPVKSYIDLFDLKEVKEKSLVIFDDGSDNVVLNEIRKKAKIKTEKNGYRYKNKKYIGPYCILQLVRSPWNRSRNILLISSSDEEMIKKNYFTRQLIMPTYTKDYNPFWGNDALIYDGRKYKVIFEFGMEICDTEQQV